MTEKLSRPSPVMLQGFHRLADLSSGELEQLAARLQLFSAPRGSRLIEIGNNDDTSLYLVEGEVELLAEDGNRRILNARDNAARRPVSRLRPSHYQVTARTNVRFLVIDNDILDDYLCFEAASSLLIDDSYSVAESTLYMEPGSEGVLMTKVFEELHLGHLVVPSIASVAEKVGSAILGAEQDVHRLSNALMIDPALAAKTIKAVNSELPAHHSPVNTCEEAVARLGTEKVISLVVNCVLRETLRQPKPAIAQRLQAWWERSLRVSAISYVLARLSERFDPDFAALAGLLHRIGEPVLLHYANDMLGEQLSIEGLEQAIQQNTNEIGRILLSMWNLSPELATVATESGNLLRDHAYAADYADIVLVAERHADFGSPQQANSPPPDEMPAFHRLGLSDVSPEFSLQIVEAAKGALQRADTLMVA